MRTFLLFLSSLFLLLIPYTAKAQEENAEVPTERLQSYSFQIETSKGYISGILLANDDGNQIKGSMINEFGVSAIDFTYNKEKQKLKLVSVIGFLNKWYIKMVLKNDIRFCLHILYNTPYEKKHNYEIIRTVDSTSIINTKRNLKYTFSPISQATLTDDTQE